MSEPAIGRRLQLSAGGLAMEAGALIDRVNSGMTTARTTDIARAKELIGQALARSPDSTGVHLVKGLVLRAEGRCDLAIPEYERVIASNRNSAGALFSLGLCKLRTGSIEEAIPLEEQSIRLSPRDPNVFNRYLVIGQVHLLQSRTEEAIVWLERARTGNPGSPWTNAWLASAYGLKGDMDRADAELAEARRLLGGRAYASIAAMRRGNWGCPLSESYTKLRFSPVCVRPGCRRNEPSKPSPMRMTRSREHRWPIKACRDPLPQSAQSAPPEPPRSPLAHRPRAAPAPWTSSSGHWGDKS
jgi:tetratricopeptide (TPR) repeat protein